VLYQSHLVLDQSITANDKWRAFPRNCAALSFSV
jgi:hypothetical protein